MSKLDCVADLLRWDAGKHVPEELWQRMLAHPQFGSAVRKLATNMQNITVTDNTVVGMFKDAGRYVAAMLAVYLHMTGGLTLPRLKEVCAAWGYSSPGRARAILIYMRYLGCIELLPQRIAGQAARYILTARLMTAWSRHLMTALEAASLIEPAIGRIVERQDDREVRDTIVRLQSAGLFALFDRKDRTSAITAAFHDHHAGHQLLQSLILADTQNFPPREIAGFSLAQAARQFHVSRIHLKRVLEAASDSGLIEHPADGKIRFTAAGREGIAHLYAAQLLGLVVAAARTFKELPELGDDKVLETTLPTLIRAGLEQPQAPAF